MSKIKSILLTFVVLSILAVSALMIGSQNKNSAVVAINVTDENSSWKITNAGNIPVKLKIENGITAMVVRNLGIGKSSEIPKEKVNITAMQDG